MHIYFIYLYLQSHTHLVKNLIVYFMRERLIDSGSKEKSVGKFLGVLIFLNNSFVLDINSLRHRGENTIFKISSLISE